MENEQVTIVDQLLDLVEQLIIPPWSDLIGWLPIVLLVLVGIWLAFTARQWRRAGARNRPRVPRALPAGAPPPGVHLPGPSRWPFVVPLGIALIFFALVLPERDEAGQITLPVNLPLFGLGMVVALVAIAGWLLDAMREWRATAQASAAVAGELGPGSRPIAAIPAAAGVEGRQLPAEPPPGVHMPGPSPWPFFAPLALTLIFFGLILSWALVLGGLILAAVAAAGWLRDANHEYRTTEQLGHPVPKTRDPAEAWPRRLVPVFIAVAGLSVVLALAPLGLSWLGSLAPTEPADGQTPGGVPEVPEITARTAVSFETSTLVVPCCREFELVFHNAQAGVPHDVAITDGPERGVVYFDGDDITGDDTIRYQVPALDEGDYYFLCTIHPNMNGTVEARPAD
jgi:hypothetical protein